MRFFEFIAYINKDKKHPVPNPPQNHLGRPRQVLDDNNELVWQLTPTDFGGVVNKELQDKTGYELNLRFTGQYFDKETGLYYNHHRYYDPSTGRYLTPDPLGLAGGENLYTYVNNSPIHYNDPVGLLLFAFDGTGNRDYDTNAPSNVVKFRDAYRRDPNEPNFPDAKWRGQKNPFSDHMKNDNIFYISGAGTEDYYTKLSGNLTDSLTGASITKRVDKMIDYLNQYLEQVEQTHTGANQPTTIYLDVIGFSRGAASARMFASKVNNLMSGKETTFNGKAWKYTTDWIKQQCNIDFKFNFMGLWDTVPSYGTNIHNDGTELANKGYALTVSKKWSKVVHAVAVNEHRSGFAVRSVFSSAEQANKYANSNNIIERGFLGAHSDIGGGYANGDLSDITLVWMANHLNSTRTNSDHHLKLSDADRKVTSPIVHDNVVAYPKLSDKLLIPFIHQFHPEREFLWAQQSTQGTYQFNDLAHLRLNWKDTLAFDTTGKFAKANELSLEYLKLKEKGQLVCVSKYNKCPARTGVHILNDYSSLKTKNQDGYTQLYDATGNNRLLITDYINWLRANNYEINGLDYSK